MSEAEKIAAGLTKAQREALLLFEPNVWHGPANPPQATKFKAVLARRGLLERSGNSPAFWFRLTPLGIEVRTILEGNDNAQ